MVKFWLDFRGPFNGFIGRQPAVTLERRMAWKKPVVTEISLGAEINSYACADLKR